MVQAEALEAGIRAVIQRLTIPAAWHDEIIGRAKHLPAPTVS
jgi:hypothetical protein